MSHRYKTTRQAGKEAGGRRRRGLRGHGPKTHPRQRDVETPGREPRDEASTRTSSATKNGHKTYLVVALYVDVPPRLFLEEALWTLPGVAPWKTVPACSAAASEGADPARSWVTPRRKRSGPETEVDCKGQKDPCSSPTTHGCNTDRRRNPVKVRGNDIETWYRLLSVYIVLECEGSAAPLCQQRRNRSGPASMKR